MNSSHEIGGYFQLEKGSFPDIHSDVFYLNSGRNALRCIIRNLKIKKIQVPYYTCPVVWHSLESENCEIIPYDIDEAFIPLSQYIDLPLLYTNYFGLCSTNIAYLEKNFSTLIVDNAQAYYAPPLGTACFWSPRKFFGLPDGGIMWPASEFARNLPPSTSWQRCTHLIKRWDLGAGAAYSDFQQNDATLDNEPPLAMSRLTRVMMSAIDYESTRLRRRENFIALHNALHKKNLLSLDLEEAVRQGSVPMVYPFRTQNGTLRRRLIENKVFVATYWPHEKGCACMTSPSAQNLANEIIPLPIDHRYDSRDMSKIFNIILGE